MLRKSVRAFVEKEVAPHVDEWEAAGQIPKTFWRRLGELGFLGLEFPVEYGGAGGDFLSSVVLGEEMARCRSGGVAFSVLVHTDMSSPWLTRYGNEAQKKKYLPGIIKGDTVCALGITEPGTGSDMANLVTRAEKKGDRYLLTGSKIFITNGVYGDLYFVAARTERGRPIVAMTASPCSSSSAGCRASRSAASSTRWACAPRTRRSWPSTSARCPRRTCWVSRGAASSSWRPASSASASWPRCWRSRQRRRRSRTRWRTSGSARPSARR